MLKKLEIDFDIPYELEESIDNLINDVNNKNGRLKDVYQDEINFCLKDWSNGLTDEQIKLLRDYYIRGRF